MTWRGIYRHGMAVVLCRVDGAKSSDPGADEQGGDERTSAGQQVHRSGAGKIAEAHLQQPTVRRPYPVRDDRIRHT